MSIEFVTSRKDIPFADLLPRLAPLGITEHEKTKGESEDEIFLTDNETGGLWAYRGEDGMLCALTCYMSNGNPGHVLCAIRRAFDTQIAVWDGYQIETDLAGEPWTG